MNLQSQEFYYEPATVQVAEDGSLVEVPVPLVEIAEATCTPEDAWSDEILLEQIARDRSEEAFSELYSRYYERVYGLLIHMLRTDEDAQDLLQEVFTQVWQKSPLFLEQRGNAAAWILSVARNRAVDEIRSKRYRERGKETILEVEEDKPEFLSSLAHSNLPDQDLHIADTQREIRSALLELSTVHRSVIDLAYFGELTHTEIAEELQMPVGTVKTKLRQAVSILGKALRPHFG